MNRCLPKTRETTSCFTDREKMCIRDSDKDNTLLWRKAWADYTNDFLERNGSPERIDPVSYTHLLNAGALGVDDADELAGVVEQAAAGIAGVDGGVSLHKRHRCV